jgi:uroporphyrin-III C-methyltransferase
VWIVGAGPGDPDLITVRGLSVLRQADVILYDRLIPRALLAEAPSHACLIYVGKEDGVASVPQEQINAMLAEHARAGRRVVRLKGGDPYVFGRGAEEVLSLVEAGIPVEVIPGITSAVAVPAAAGIPVSHRDHGSSIAIVAGHRAGDRDLPWDALAGIDTLVFLMGAARVTKICSHLIETGVDPATPVAAVRWGTTPRQQELFSTLGRLPEDFARASFGPPVTLVVGRVVALAERIRTPSALAVRTGGGAPR